LGLICICWSVRRWRKAKSARRREKEIEFHEPINPQGHYVAPEEDYTRNELYGVDPGDRL
jgi:hypothetical protein